jgi:hypothetical protein
MINWKRVAITEYRYAKSIERDSLAREEEINRMYFPAGAVATPVTRADIRRSAHMWRSMVGDLERKLNDERAAHLATVAELEGWKNEALASRLRESRQ